MALVNEPYCKWRDTLLPVIRAAAQKNQHDFVDDVDRALLSGKAFLFLSDEGFFALRPFDGDKVCVVFACSFSHGCTVKYQPVIETLSRAIGAKYIEFETALVGGFEALCARLGYVKVEQIGNVTRWRKELV